MIMLIKKKIHEAKKAGKTEIVLTFEETHNILDAVKDMDEKLAKCIDTMSVEDVAKIFPLKGY